MKNFILWPGMGKTTGWQDWEEAGNFVPKGCRKVKCDGIDATHTRCDCGDIELIVFIVKLNHVDLRPPLHPLVHTDFHAIGREIGKSGPAPWHSKEGANDEISDITDADQSLHSAYKFTKGKETKKLCFCCKKAEMVIQ
jgi:hypothetical protein